MAGFGQSPAARKGESRGGAPAAKSALSPSASWDGTAESGFETVPTDPERTTAKPAVHLIDLPCQFFDDELTVSAMAFANDGGTLIGGIDRVRFHFEGNVADVIEPQLRTFTRFDGSTYRLPCYTVTLEKPAGTSGDTHLYIEAIPADATMQSRVIGPFDFFPRDPFANGTLHDIDLTVDDTQPVVAGSNYHDFTAAHTYVNAQNAENPRITIRSNPAAGFHEIKRGHWAGYAPKGWLTIEADIPVVFDRPAPFVDEATAYSGQAARPNLDGIWFKGPNITLELQRQSLYTEFDSQQHGCAFDGIRIRNSAGIGFIWMGTHRQLGVARGKNYFLDSLISDVPNAFNEARLARGNINSGGWWDYASNAKCLVGNICSDHSSAEAMVHTLALTAQYTGTGSTATLEMSGVNSASTRTVTAKVDGETVGTLTVRNVGATFNPSNAEFPSDVVDWINTLPDWTATLEDDTYKASMLGLSTNLGTSFGPQDAKSAPLELYARPDPHNDWWQAQIVWGDPYPPFENVIAYGNIAYDFAGQKLFLSTFNPLNDVFFVNNALHDLDGVSAEPKGDFFSQFDRGEHSHVVVAHCSIEQGLLLRTNTTDPYGADEYCLIAASVFGGIEWEGTPDADLSIAGNHTFTGTTAPAGASGHSIGGTVDSLFADAGAGDFAPEGALAENLKAPVVLHDLAGNRRASSCAAGAIG
ncbi:hypothetical protein SAMN04515621_1768 [Erythrobacter sp. HL-111]|nr:MAG: hypothetical protein HLUCCO15_04450 [Erythrobacteraceae bacterium HL-111]SDS54756.1 hypothetical protein SAMN04515621_1768 [Erythrobacter sp. HL-111]